LGERQLDKLEVTGSSPVAPIPVTRLGTALLACVAGIVLPALIANSASASVRCALSDDGTLFVTPYVNTAKDLDFADGTVRRRGVEILVRDARGPQHCLGQTPTVYNTQQIRVRQRGLAFSTLDLRGGPLRAPGGAAIEVVFHVAARGLGYGIIEGTGADDRWALRRHRGESRLALDGRLEPQITFEGLGRTVVWLVPGGGSDSVTVSRRLAAGAIIAFAGGGGSDDFLGSNKADYAIGGPGRDRIVSRGGNDRIGGGPGSDRLFAGPGADRVRIQDRSRDRAGCGPGVDRIGLDSKDVFTSCEFKRFSRR
jgi:hypothetical protein